MTSQQTVLAYARQSRRRRRSIESLLGSLLILFAAGTANSAIITTNSPTAPSGSDVLIANPTFVGTTTWSEAGASNGQTFNYPSTFVLDKVTIWIHDTVGGGKPVNFYLFTYANNSTVVPTELVSFQSGTTPSGLTAWDYLTFDIDDVALAGGQQYGFVLEYPPGSGGSDNIEHNAGTYSQGTHVQRFDHDFMNGSVPNTGGWAGVADLVFFVEGSVPEPSITMRSVGSALSACADGVGVQEAGD